VKVALVVLLAAALAGCGESTIISADGTAVVAHCGGDGEYPTAVCVLKNCPNGAYTLKRADGSRADPVMRCIGDQAKTP